MKCMKNFNRDHIYIYKLQKQWYVLDLYSWHVLECFSESLHLLENSMRLQQHAWLQLQAHVIAKEHVNQVSVSGTGLYMSSSFASINAKFASRSFFRSRAKELSAHLDSYISSELRASSFLIWFSYLIWCVFASNLLFSSSMALWPSPIISALASTTVSSESQSPQFPDPIPSSSSLMMHLTLSTDEALQSSDAIT